MNKQEMLRALPAVDRLLREPVLQSCLQSLPRRVVLEGVQTTLQRYRQMIASAADKDLLHDLDLSAPTLAGEAAALAAGSQVPRLRRVINATGTILHTNLGRAPLAERALKALEQVAAGYSNLEYDLGSGERGSRQAHLEELLCRLTGAEAALVVNNNAAAVLLAVSSLAVGREVIVSRGELVEIGGSFRLPEVMSAGGAILVEVGTTNKTYLVDYAAAVNENTAALLKVHTSNYRIVGFTASVAAAELVALARERGLLVIEDLGSGVLLEPARYGLPGEPSVRDCVAAGVDLVTFSGDKLLGGPQAGIIVGRGELVRRLRQNQLARALRVDKFTVAALEATLRLYLDEEAALREIPVWRMLTLAPGHLKRRASALARRLKGAAGLRAVEVVPGVSRVGGGAFPLAELPTFLVSLQPGGLTPQEMAGRLRSGEPPVVVRLQQDRVLLDPRTVDPREDKELAAALAKALTGTRCS